MSSYVAVPPRLSGRAAYRPHFPGPSLTVKMGCTVPTQTNLACSACGWHQRTLQRFRSLSLPLGASGPPPPRASASPGGRVHLFGGALRGLLLREAMPEEYWEVADLHCAAFFPGNDLLMDYILRSDRVLALLANLGMPAGLRKKCLVAVEGPPAERGPAHFDAARAFPGGPLLRPLLASFAVGLPLSLGTASGLNLGPRGIVGTVTVDNAAEFLRRRQPGRRRRQLTAYISNMAVRSVRRRRGAAKQLLQKAEEEARGWGCRSVALHCDVNNRGAVGLYCREGYRVVRPPPGAKWPKPWAGPDVELVLMMKTLVRRQP